MRRRIGRNSRRYRTSGLLPTRRFALNNPVNGLNQAQPVILGLVSTKSQQLETRDDLKRRIEEASKYVDAERLAISPQCGFASVASGNPTTPDMQEAKLSLVVEVANEVWPDA